MITVKISDMPTASVSSSFLARAAAAAAIAADTPHTEVAAAITMTSDGLAIFSTRVPNRYMKMMTVGVTTQATNKPGTPRRRTLPNRISAPSSTRPVLMYSSLRSAGLIHAGVPTVLAISRPIARAQNAYPTPAARIPVCCAKVYATTASMNSGTNPAACLAAAPPIIQTASVVSSSRPPPRAVRPPIRAAPKASPSEAVHRPTPGTPVTSCVTTPAISRPPSQTAHQSSSASSG